MDTVNCKMCGKLFYYQFGAPICIKCRDILDEKFEKVKEYIYENPGATVQVISDANDVSTHQIIKWVREERLEFTPDSIVGVDCEICGITIKTGRFCKSCKDDLKSKLGKAFNKPIPEEVKKELKQKSAKKFLDNIRNK